MLASLPLCIVDVVGNGQRGRDRQRKTLQPAPHAAADGCWRQCFRCRSVSEVTDIDSLNTDILSLTSTPSLFSLGSRHNILQKFRKLRSLWLHSFPLMTAKLENSSQMSSLSFLPLSQDSFYQLLD